MTFPIRAEHEKCHKGIRTIVCSKGVCGGICESERRLQKISSHYRCTDSSEHLQHGIVMCIVLTRSLPLGHCERGDDVCPGIINSDWLEERFFLSFCIYFAFVCGVLSFIIALYLFLSF